jgi:hypothetical protein
MEFDQETAYRGLVHVRDPKSGSCGTGVLTEGGCILTVAHIFYQNIPDPEAYRGFSARLSVRSLSSETENLLLIAQVDTCLDSAILGASGAHGNLFDDEADEFEAFKAAMTLQPIQLIDRSQTETLPVWIYSHNIGWIQGSANVDPEYPHYLLIDPEGSVVKGMSGGPVFTADGRVIGCLIGSSDRNEKLAFANILSACLPGWALDAHKRQAAWLSRYSRKFGGIDLDNASSWNH